MTFRVNKDFGRRRYLRLLSALLCWFLGSDISVSRLAPLHHHYYDTHWGGGLKGNERRTAVKPVKLDLISVWSLSPSQRRDSTLSFSFLSVHSRGCSQTARLPSIIRAPAFSENTLLGKTLIGNRYKMTSLKRKKKAKLEMHRKKGRKEGSINRCRDVHNFTTTLFHQNIYWCQYSIQHDRIYDLEQIPFTH